MQGDPLALVSNAATQNAQGWFRDQPSFFGVKLSSSLQEEDVTSKSSSLMYGAEKDLRNEGDSSLILNRIRPGVITVGMYDLVLLNEMISLS